MIVTLQRGLQVADPCAGEDVLPRDGGCRPLVWTGRCDLSAGALGALCGCDGDGWTPMLFGLGVLWRVPSVSARQGGYPFSGVDACPNDLAHDQGAAPNGGDWNCPSSTFRCAYCLSRG